MRPSATRISMEYLLTVLVVLTCVGVLGISTPASAAECDTCHVSGGIAPDGSAHPVPPFATVSSWDSRDGQCTVCHEVPDEILPGYQNPPHGPVPASLAANMDHQWIIDTNCDQCHYAAHGVVKSGPVFAMPDSSVINIAGSDCAGCHTTGMADGEAYPASAVPQVDANHGDVALAHATAASEYCLDCHQADFSARHPDCLTCHAAGTPTGEMCVSCHPGYDSGHGYILRLGSFNSAHDGYLSWDYAVATDPVNNVGSPHGGYTASTNKCAVCHSVHQATPGGSVLTAYGPYATYAAGCVACHGDTSTFTDVRMTANADGYISPHGTCTRCHTLNPHGAEGSQYAVLAGKLLNTVGDGYIAADLAANENNLDAGMFDGTGDAEAGLILGTGYLCSACHMQAFAVNDPGYDPAGGRNLTGHRVLANATDTWDNSLYGASMTATSTVAFADAYGCDSCHSAQDINGDSAFPHGYVDATGAVSPKTVAGSSYIWLTTAANAGEALQLLETTEPDSPILLSKDGLCLKCHRSASDAAGVGISY